MTLPPPPGTRRGVALLITLAILTIVSTMLIGFVVSTRQDRGATQSYGDSLRADQIALGGLDAVVASLRAEMANPAFSTAYSSNGFPVYLPVAATNAMPQSTVASALYPLLKVSGRASYYSNGIAVTNIPVSGALSSTASLNTRRVSATRWAKPQLVPAAAAGLFPAPAWVLVDRTGPFAPANASPVAAGAVPGLGSPHEVQGRFAYAVYDLGGLLDINVAGHPGAVGNKGLMPWADLSAIGAASGLTGIPGVRNAGSAASFAAYLSAWATNGFLTVGNGDTSFLSRQELIDYATTKGFADALPYLTVFSRELNGPSWSPSQPPGAVGVNYADPKAFQGAAGVSNFFLPAARVTGTAWTRNNGLAPVLGEPLVKYRFPLGKLALLQTAATAPAGIDAATIKKYFGLTLDTTTPGAFKRWNYTSPAGNTVANSIQTLDAISGREPDFFELLKATILTGSLGKAGRGDDWGTAATSESSRDDQIIQIGLDIIDQAGGDDLPSTVVFSGLEFYGVKDLPYISQIFVGCVPDASPPTTSKIHFFFNLWNPHQQTTAAASLPNLQLVALPTGGNDFSLQYGISSTDAWPASAGSFSGAAAIAIPSGTDYRSPLLLNGTGGSGIFNGSASSFSVSVAPPANADQSGLSHTPWSTARNNPAQWGLFLNGINQGAVFALQYQDPLHNKWHTYGVFTGRMQASGTAIEGLKMGTSVASLRLNNDSTDPATVLANSDYFTKSDPRTVRWAASWNTTPYSSTQHALGGTNFKPALLLPKVIIAPPVPFDLSQWCRNAVGDPTAYADNDGVTRPGDYSGGGTGNDPFTLGNARPVVLERPFASVGELGYVFRDLPWKSLDFSSTNSADAGLLDLFTVGDGAMRRTASGPIWTTAGRLNPNTPYYQPLAALLSGAAKDLSLGANTISPGDAATLAQALTNLPAATPYFLTNRANLADRFLGAATVPGTALKPEREAVLRALAESANTRTWNLLIDVVAQTGRYPATATSFDSFLVTGERRYWLHVAIDRYTGEIVDQQLEAVSE